MVRCDDMDEVEENYGLRPIRWRKSGLALFVPRAATNGMRHWTSPDLCGPKSSLAPGGFFGKSTSGPGLWLDGNGNALLEPAARRALPGDGAGMKGYLQRLVRTATNPADLFIRWTGSIFAAVHPGDLKWFKPKHWRRRLRPHSRRK